MSTPGEREAIGVREFARREGCDPKVIMRAKERGQLQCDASGRPYADQVKGAWRKLNRRHDDGVDVDVDSSPRVNAAASVDGAQAHKAAMILAALQEPGGVLPVATAEAMKETYLARLKQLDYEERAGRVVRIEDVAGRVARVLAQVRTRLMALPSEMAPAVTRLRTPAEVQDALSRAVTECLEGLTLEGTVSPRP